MIRAVICDDEKATHDIIRYLIDKEGYPIQIVGTAMNGSEAVQLIRREKPDLAFMDINMPYLNGFEVIQNVKNMKIIMITAYNTFEHAQRALRLKVSDILAKPIHLDQLQESIEKVLGGKFTKNEIVNQAVFYIQQHYRENIKLEDLAREVCCSASYLSRLFRAHMGETVFSYIHRLRINEAATLLIEEGMSIKEVSALVGYKAINNFYKYFKIYIGETPALYIKNKTNCSKTGEKR